MYLIINTAIFIYWSLCPIKLFNAWVIMNLTLSIQVYIEEDINESICKMYFPSLFDSRKKIVFAYLN